MTPKEKAMKKLCKPEFIGHRDIEYPQAYDAQVKKLNKIVDTLIDDICNKFDVRVHGRLSVDRFLMLQKRLKK